MRKIKPLVFWPPFLILMISLVYSLINGDNFIAQATRTNNFLLSNFGGLYAIAALSFFLLCIAVYFSPIAKMRIGGENAQPILSKWKWFSITLCTTIAIGILFWGTAEPLFHLHGPPEGLNLEPNSKAAVNFSMSTLMLHWTLIPYSMYTVAGLLFALMYYNARRPFSLGALLYPIFGDRVNGRAGEMIDAICLYSLVAGMAASLGAGILSISGGMETLLGIESTPLVLGLITLLIVGAYTLSAASGLMRGIRLLSDWNIKAFIGLAIFVFLAGPTWFILKTGATGTLEFFSTFFQSSLYKVLHPEDNWSESWTIFYWANWLAWTPVSGLFLGRLAVGYTVREFIRFNLIYTSLFGATWMMIFGGTALFQDFHTAGNPLYEVLNTDGPENIIYEVFAQLPLARLMSFIFLVITFLSFVTASDSNTSAMSGISATGISPEHPEPSFWIKILWGATVGAVAWTMVTFSGIDGVKMTSNLGGFPILFLMILVAVALGKVAWGGFGDELNP